MGDVYADLLDSITGIDPLQEEPEQISPVAPAVVDTHQEFIRDLNILNNIVNYDFKNEKIAADNELMTAPHVTTVTLDAYVDNLSFAVADLITKLEPNKHVVKLRCNFSEDKLYSGYVQPPPPVKTNRGRKKKEKVGKQRKRQGNGRNFNNQITFETRASENSSKVYKFKVFHNGRIQLPGTLPADVDEIITCAGHIVDALKEVSVCGDLVYICPVMKNYKFRIHLEKGFIIDMPVLADLIHGEHYIPSADAPSHPAIFMSEYVRKKQKISVTFRTPIPGNEQKTTLLTIMESGKVNILGGLYTNHTREMFEFITWILRKNQQNVIIIRPVFAPACRIVHVEIPQKYITAAIKRDRIAEWVGRITKSYGEINVEDFI